MTKDSRQNRTAPEPAEAGRVSRFSLLIPAASLFFIILALVANAFFARSDADARSMESLRSSAAIRAEALQTTLNTQADVLNTVAKALARNEPGAVDAILRDLRALSTGTSFGHVCFTTTAGVCYSDDGRLADISRREYFQTAMDGNWTVQRIDTPVSGEPPLFVLAVPFVFQGQVAGVVHGSYSAETVEELIKPQVYGGEAYSLACREDGAVMVGNRNPNSELRGSNVFVFLSSVDLDGSMSAAEIRKAVKAGESGSFAYMTDSGRRYGVWTPLDVNSATGERWALFTFLPAAVVDADAGRITRQNVALFALVFLAVAVSFIYILSLKSKNTALLKQERDRLRDSDIENRAAISAGGIVVARYDLKAGVYFNSSDILFRQGFGSVIENVPQVFIDAGLVAPESVEEFRGFYEGLRQGRAGVLHASLRLPDGSFRWFRKDASFVLDGEGQPSQAIIVYKDETEQREKDFFYVKWQQSIRQRDESSYTLFRCNLSKSASFNSMEGTLLTVQFSPRIKSFNGRTREYAGRFVHLDDFDAYVELLNAESLLEKHYRGESACSMEYRERLAEGKYRWLKVSVETVQYPDSDEVEVFLMYEDIDALKRREQAAKSRAELDPITGVLNRASFTERFDRLLQEMPDCRHALILVDIDGFKQLNDTFGHMAGDQALADMAESLRRAVRGEDLLGRLGGDEFLICLRNIPNEAVVEKKAVQIQALLRKAFSLDIHISASMGIALFPESGRDFKTLYHNVDAALFTAKESGRDSFSFYGGVAQTALPAAAPPPQDAADRKRTAKRRILIVGSDGELETMLEAMFRDSYIIETSSDERGTFVRLHRYGVSLAAVLLRFDIPELDSLALLDRMKRTEGVKAVPVIALCGAGDRQKGLEAVHHGACEFLLEPLEPELLRIRMSTALGITENDRLRAQNAQLQLQSGEGSKYRTVFENTGTVVVEYDWLAGQFSYDPDISEHLYGRYDGRPLWQILLSDMVADAMDVKAMQTMVHDLAFDRSQRQATMDVLLKTPEKTRHWFTVNAFKRISEINLTSRVVLTFADVNENVLSGERLRFQAEHDSLTGLYNRGAFLKLVGDAVREKPPSSFFLLCCDINNFRLLNDRFGRAEGDRLLQYSAEELRRHADGVGSFAGRLGNDVFAILLPNTPGVLERVSAIVRDFFTDYPLKAALSSRAGAYLINEPCIPTDTMLDCASVAKDSIKGRYGACLALFDESMNAQALLEKNISDRMEEALAKGHFDVYIQPQFDHSTGKVVGAEALARWLDPKEGVISPAVFIPVFEKNGFITKLDSYIWERTAQHLRAWLDGGNEAVPISVNVSREDISDPELRGKLLAIIEKYRIPMELFRLEITESLFSEDTERLIEVVEQLHDFGFLIEMDDFGSGYSSLNILKDVPVDILKLDMRFFTGRDALGRGGMIINSVLRMAHWLNIPVIAEGVETMQQADFLLSAGCRTIQGFLYAKPLPAAEFEALILEKQGDVSGAAVPSVTDSDAAQLWNPESMDTRLFDRFIGGAFLLEYRAGQYELIRVNRECMELLCMEDEFVLPSGGLVNLYHEDRQEFDAAVLRAIGTGRTVSLYARRTAVGDAEMLRLRVTLRLMAGDAERALLLGTLAP